RLRKSRPLCSQLVEVWRLNEPVSRGPQSIAAVLIVHDEKNVGLPCRRLICSAEFRQRQTRCNANASAENATTGGINVMHNRIPRMSRVTVQALFGGGGSETDTASKPLFFERS